MIIDSEPMGAAAGGGVTGGGFGLDEPGVVGAEVPGCEGWDACGFDAFD